MKKRLIGIIALVAIIGSYLVFRYPLFNLHGMKEFPLAMCGVGVFFIAITGLIRNNKIIPPMIALGYIVGFIAGALFEYDYGEGLNNMWIIWLWCFVVASIIGVFIDLILKKKAKKQ